MDSTGIVLSKSNMWAQRIQDYQLSGLTCKEWCEENQVSVSTLGYWIRKQKMENSKLVDESTVFAKLPSGDEILRNSARPAPITVHLGYIRIEVADECPQQLLSNLVSMLKNYA